MVLQEKTLITGFHGHLETWGPVVQSNSDDLVYMATFGHWIDVACLSRVVSIYNAVTGALRLSLGPMDPVKVARGSPDGSVLFCAHKNSVTVWDAQTGGLIHTFTFTEEVRGIAVSLKNRYFVCGFSNGSAKIWGVASRMEDTAIATWDVPPDAHFCWLEPEERLAIAGGASVHIWNVITGTILRSFSMGSPTGVVYCQGLDRLAVALAPPECLIAIINLQTEEVWITSGFQGQLFCFAFSRTTGELVCGTRNGLLELFSCSALGWRHFEYPDNIESVSFLPDGTIAAMF